MRGMHDENIFNFFQVRYHNIGSTSLRWEVSLFPHARPFGPSPGVGNDIGPPGLRERGIYRASERGIYRASERGGYTEPPREGDTPASERGGYTGPPREGDTPASERGGYTEPPREDWLERDSLKIGARGDDGRCFLRAQAPGTRNKRGWEGRDGNGEGGAMGGAICGSRCKDTTEGGPFYGTSKLNKVKISEDFNIWT